MEYYSTDHLSDNEMLIAIIAVAMGLSLFLAIFVNIYLPIRTERYYIKREMARSHDKEEYLYWKRELKMLYISRIPIIRSIVERKYNR